ncbi:glycoside hydrolase family 16 protein [Aaosphaeria arxii CBS 175.79]|uniref:Crh-like protein n=1 Tax=Aaosphaeria arxii CBS 175.79 TaxID=1450172 RepID=A0A6A5XCL7_9PLEO|nr:glycoside hydrolase family 16 protein [Aaosphaeria arxii CBS 175.79]KAF2010659.1 glycoside hydrolase family 16 protein [Aaosphaeria arxii CBS 175.79]
MVRSAFATLFAASALVGSALSATTGPKGTRAQHCPKDAPCTSLYGDCGVGAFCLGGCDPTMSYSMKSCVPNPVCKSGKYDLTSLNDIQSIDKYLGDNSKVNWQSQGKPIVYGESDSILLTMAEGTSGTLLASTFYVWYGKICATMSTSQGRGVVTAFIMMSDVKDEIDFEWVGVDLETAQSNFYSQGVTTYTNAKNLTVGNTVEKLHEYCIDWQPDTLKWSVDGEEMRTLNRKDTWNGTANRFDYPQTPSRVMLSLWPAGLATNEKGTRDWAGGEIDWNSPYMQNGYYLARVKQVTVDCYDPPSNAKKSGNKSYKYTDDKNPTNNTIEISNDFTILGSLLATGEDPDEGKVTSSNAPKPTKSAASVPGGNPGGGNRAEDNVSSSAAAQSTGAASTGSPETPNPGTSGGEWQQDKNGGNSPNAGASLQPGLSNVGGSAFAIVVALLGLIAL